MNSHELGDEYERVCKAYLEELYSKTNPKFVDTKLNKVHGIDFAMSLNDDEIIFIVESKGKYGQVSKKQMTKEWIQKRITPELAGKIKNNIAKNGIIKYLSFRVNNDNPENPIIKRISPSGFLDKEGFANLGKSDIQQSNNFTKKNTTNMQERVLEFQIYLLEELKKDLEKFQQTLGENLKEYQNKVAGLAQQGIDRSVLEHFQNKCLLPTTKIIEDLQTQIHQKDLAELQKIQEGITHVLNLLTGND